MTKAEWLGKIQSWVPLWVVEDTKNVVPILDAFAALMADHDSELGQLIAETFIGTADGSWLDTIGDERSVFRSAGESDDAFRVRVRSQNLISRADLPNLQALIDQFLIRGKSSVHEDNAGNFYFNRGAFFNRAVVTFPLIKDAFTVVVDRQLHLPYSYIGRGAYFGRQNFMGTTEPSLQVFNQIIRALNENRAFGALFRIVERLN